MALPTWLTRENVEVVGKTIPLINLFIEIVKYCSKFEIFKNASLGMFLITIVVILAMSNFETLVKTYTVVSKKFVFEKETSGFRVFEGFQKYSKNTYKKNILQTTPKIHHTIGISISLKRIVFELSVR